MNNITRVLGTLTGLVVTAGCAAGWHFLNFHGFVASIGGLIGLMIICKSLGFNDCCGDCNKDDNLSS